MIHPMSFDRYLRVCLALIAVVSLGLAQGCSPDLEREHFKSAPGDNPHDTDSLYVLTRRMLNDKDPRAINEAFLCQTHLLDKRIGFDEANRRMAVTVDTALHSSAEKRRWRSVVEKLPLYYGDQDSLCARTAARARGDTTHMPIAP